MVTAKRLPHLIMFQEMDMQAEILEGLNSLDKDVYGDFEYTYEIMAKTGDHTDALCIFYDTKQFKMVSAKKDHYRGPNGDNVSNRWYLMTLFEHIETGKKFAACTLHLKSKPHNRKIRGLEIVEYLQKLSDFKTEIQSDGYVSDLDKLPIIFAGDFNDDPDSSVIETVFDPEMTHGINFKYAYHIDGKFPDYTTHKYRNEEVTKHTIDYIFYNENLQLKSIREIPTEDEIEIEIGHPCHRYPSDHFALGATFEI